MNSAIILSGGRGKRMQADISKQYMLLLDKPIILHTLEVFQSASLIDNIVLVIGEGDLDYINNMLAVHRFNKISHVIAGGPERQHSVSNGLRVLDAHCEIVAIHDGARPLVTAEIVNTSVMLAKQYGAVSCGMPIKETVKLISAEGYVESTPNREKVWVTQTPQTFKKDIILKAHAYAAAQGIIGTDDAALVELEGIPVKMFQGSYENIKVTTPEDLITAEGILNLRR